MLVRPGGEVNRPDGYRYVRSYWRGDDRDNWALWEVRDGRACRVGTARTEEAYRAFLCGGVA